MIFKQTNLIIGGWIWFGSVILPLSNVFSLNLTREDAVEYALINSEVVRVQEMMEKESALAITEARSSFLPQLDVIANYDRNWTLQSLVFNGSPITIGSENDVRAVVGLRQAIFTGGRNNASVNIAESFHLLSKSRSRLIRQDIVAQTEHAFYDVLVARELSSVAVLALKSARKTFDLIRMRRAVGQGSAFEELRARGHVSSMEADSITAVNNILLTHLKLKSLIGFDPETEIDVKGDLSRFSSWTNVDLDSLMQIALEMRPDLIAIKHQLSAQKQKVSLEKSARLPVIDFVISGQAQMQGDRLIDENAKWRRNWSTGLNLRVPIFDGFRIRSRIRQAETQLEALHYEILNLKRKIKFEVETSIRLLDEAVARVQAGKQVKIEAEKAIEMAHSRYSTGVGTQLEVLDAQLFLVRTKTNLTIAKRDRALRIIDLDRSLGLLK